MRPYTCYLVLTGTTRLIMVKLGLYIQNNANHVWYDIIIITQASRYDYDQKGHEDWIKIACMC